MIGIIGGVGPLAGLDIVTKIIEETIATTDQEHLPVLLSSQPHRIADRTAYLLGQESENPAYAIAEIIQELEKQVLPWSLYLVIRRMLHVSLMSLKKS